MNLLLTGASGFIGREVMRVSLSRGLSVFPVFRTEASASHSGVNVSSAFIFPTMDGDTDWSSVLSGITAVVHAAARVHIMDDPSADPLVVFRAVNVAGTLNLARQAAEAGVKRFVFVSSVKVNGESTQPETVFLEQDTPAPEDAYGISKYEAEQGLMELSSQTGMEVVIVRPPLVYGPGVKGNFAAMCRWVARGVPLPLGAVHNRRSLVALDNLVDFLVLCADRNRSPAAANQMFVISDGEDVSTTTLLQRVARAQGKKARLLPVPVPLMRWGARLLGKQDVAERLLGNLQVDSRKARELLGWQPVVTMEQQLAKMFSADV